MTDVDGAIHSLSGNQNERETPSNLSVSPVDVDHEVRLFVEDTNNLSSDCKNECIRTLNTLEYSNSTGALIDDDDQIQDDLFHTADSVTLELQPRLNNKVEFTNDKISSSNEEDLTGDLSEKISSMELRDDENATNHDDQRDSLESVPERQSIMFQGEAFGEMLGKDQKELSPIICKSDCDESLHVFDAWTAADVVESPVKKPVVPENDRGQNIEKIVEHDIYGDEPSNFQGSGSKKQCSQRTLTPCKQKSAQEQPTSELFEFPQTSSNSGENNKKDNSFASQDVTSNHTPSRSESKPIHSLLELEKEIHLGNIVGKPETISNSGENNMKDDPFSSPDLTANRISSRPENTGILSPLALIKETAEVKTTHQSDSDQWNRDLSSAQKKLDATSVLLIERLRGAAQRRNLQVTRSRDSLAAKEKQQLLTNAESKKQMPRLPEEDFAKTIPQQKRIAQKKQTEGSNLHKPFKARPLPSTTGDEGIGGLVGVPKVEKRQATTPFSPQLGPHRRGKVRVKALDPPKKKQSHSSCRESLLKIRSASKKKMPSTQDDPYMPFKALPVPKSVCASCHGGQAGVPKISKRAVTVALSPHLGPRQKHRIDIGSPENERSSIPIGTFQKPDCSSSYFHPPRGLLSGSGASRAKEQNLRERIKREELEAKKKRQFRARSLPKYSSSSAPNSLDTSVRLLGLNLLSNGNSSEFTRQRSKSSMGLENIPPPNTDKASATTQKTKHRHSLPYNPHSTKRAQERAIFDTRQVQREKKVSKERQQLRQSLMKIRAEEIKLLRQKI